MGGWPDDDAIIAMLEGLSYDSPGGYIHIRADNHQGYKDAITGYSLNVGDYRSRSPTPSGSSPCPSGTSRRRRAGPRVSPRRPTSGSRRPGPRRPPDRADRHHAPAWAPRSEAPAGRWPLRPLTAPPAPQMPAPCARRRRAPLRAAAGRARCPGARRRLLTVGGLAGLLAAGLLAPDGASAGHEFPFYPSFYPQEITIEVVPPGDAARRLADGTLHAYAGPDPFGSGPVPASVGAVESLDAWVLIAPVGRRPGQPLHRGPDGGRRPGSGSRHLAAPRLPGDPAPPRLAPPRRPHRPGRRPRGRAGPQSGASG